jgi:hypothetical protein
VLLCRRGVDPRSLRGSSKSFYRRAHPSSDYRIEDHLQSVTILEVLARVFIPSGKIFLLLGSHDINQGFIVGEVRHAIDAKESRGVLRGSAHQFIM